MKFFLSVCVFEIVWDVFLCCCWRSFVLQEQRIWLCGSLLVVDEVQTRTFRIPDPRSSQPLHSNILMAALDDSPNWLIFILQPLQTIVELARCERVMKTQVEFHFSLVYTFSATHSSLWIWAPDPPRGTGCNPVLPAQLRWSSGSSFPSIHNTSI